MSRRLITIASTLLMIATIAWWIRSYAHSETIYRLGNSRALAIDTFGGEVSFWIGRVPDESGVLWGHEHYHGIEATTAQEFSVVNSAGDERFFAGFGVTNRRKFPVTHRVVPLGFVSEIRGLVVPLWFVTSVFAIAPLIWLATILRNRRRLRTGCCRVCGYDLRASADRCPECGTEIAAAIT